MMGCKHCVLRRDCRRCRFHDWFYGYKSHYLGFWCELPLIILYQPFWWLKYGRYMDSKGFMPDEEGYKK